MRGLCCIHENIYGIMRVGKEKEEEIILYYILITFNLYA